MDQRRIYIFMMLLQNGHEEMAIVFISSIGLLDASNDFWN